MEVILVRYQQRQKQGVNRRLLGDLGKIARCAQIFQSPAYQKFLSLISSKMTQLSSYEALSIFNSILRGKNQTTLTSIQLQILHKILTISVNNEWIYMLQVDQLVDFLNPINDFLQNSLFLTEHWTIYSKLIQQVREMYHKEYQLMSTEEIIRTVRLLLQYNPQQQIYTQLLSHIFKNIEPSGQSSIDPIFILRLISYCKKYSLFDSIDKNWQNKIVNMIKYYFIDGGASMGLVGIGLNQNLAFGMFSTSKAKQILLALSENYKNTKKDPNQQQNEQNKQAQVWKLRQQSKFLQLFTKFYMYEEAELTLTEIKKTSRTWERKIVHLYHIVNQMFLTEAKADGQVQLTPRKSMFDKLQKEQLVAENQQENQKQKKLNATERREKRKEQRKKQRQASIEKQMKNQEQKSSKKLFSFKRKETIEENKNQTTKQQIKSLSKQQQEQEVKIESSLTNQNIKPKEKKGPLFSKAKNIKNSNKYGFCIATRGTRSKKSRQQLKRQFDYILKGNNMARSGQWISNFNIRFIECLVSSLAYNYQYSALLKILNSLTFNLLNTQSFSKYLFYLPIPSHYAPKLLQILQKLFTEQNKKGKQYFGNLYSSEIQRIKNQDLRSSRQQAQFFMAAISQMTNLARMKIYGNNLVSRFLVIFARQKFIKDVQHIIKAESLNPAQYQLLYIRILSTMLQKSPNQQQLSSLITKLTSIKLSNPLPLKYFLQIALTFNLLTKEKLEQVLKLNEIKSSNKDIYQLVQKFVKVEGQSLSMQRILLGHNVEDKDIQDYATSMETKLSKSEINKLNRKALLYNFERIIRTLKSKNLKQDTPISMKLKESITKFSKYLSTQQKIRILSLSAQINCPLPLLHQQLSLTCKNPTEWKTEIPAEQLLTLLLNYPSNTSNNHNINLSLIDTLIKIVQYCPDLAHVLDEKFDAMGKMRENGEFVKMSKYVKYMNKMVNGGKSAVDDDSEV